MFSICAIAKLDLMFPRTVFIKKSVLISEALTSAEPTTINFPNFRRISGNFLPNTLGNNSDKLS